jgi:hypothetical protein
LIVFICGCDSKLSPPITRENFKTFDSVVEDQEGFLVCINHHERLKGWRSVPYTAAAMPREINTASFTPLEYERWRIFGEKPRTRVLSLSFDVPDNRDVRDPRSVGNEILAQRNGKAAQKEYRSDWPR